MKKHHKKKGKKKKNPTKSLPTLPKSLQDPSDFHMYKKY